MNTEKIQRLYEPFEENDIEWRVQSGGVKNGKPWAIVLAYVTARAVQDRLDEVFGTLCWKMEYTIGSKGVLCHLSVKGETGEWITKTDGAPETDIESFKGGISNAFKRVASAGFGIGRYLYKLDKNYANFDENGIYSAKIDDGSTKRWFKWNPPKLPKWALPINTNDEPLDQDRILTIESELTSRGINRDKFFAWLKKEFGASKLEHIKQGEYVKVYAAVMRPR